MLSLSLVADRLIVPKLPAFGPLALFFLRKLPNWYSYPRKQRLSHFVFAARVAGHDYLGTETSRAYECGRLARPPAGHLLQRLGVDVEEFGRFFAVDHGLEPNGSFKIP
jgi:hypothetical protein